ncbi:MAG: IS630 family transposase [Desulfobacteraceae bacterium]|nr:IS630 family transposase [Desulfobacteraceae bacterium]MBC2748950.1 IS630 family transposase [Desulfobacteraceae bacterium]
MEKTDTRKLKPEVQQELRNQAIRLRKTGRTYKEIGAIIGVHPTNVCKWWKAYEQGGQKAIKHKPRGRRKGACRTLTDDRERELQRSIKDHCPDQMKLPFALWTRVAVQQLVKQLYSIQMPIRTVGEYLKRWGFTPQKPLTRAYEKNPKAVGQWLDETYPTIAERAKSEDAEIHWGDETGLLNNAYYHRSYAPAGKTPAIRLPAKREKISMISTVTNQGKVRFMVYEDAMNAKTLVRFMTRLIKDADRKVFLILDNLRTHHSKPVCEWLEKHREKIEVFYLPSYSPELNPDEYLNRDLKLSVHRGKPARTKTQLKRKTIGHLRKLQKLPKRIIKYFKDPNIAYAA